MKRIIILGAGTAGTMMANHLRHHLSSEEWEIDIVDERTEHHYQPGYLFLPFDVYEPEDIIKPIKDFMPRGVNLINDQIGQIAPEAQQVRMVNGELRCPDHRHRRQNCPGGNGRHVGQRMAKKCVRLLHL